MVPESNSLTGEGGAQQILVPMMGKLLKISYEIVGNLAIAEGDIILGELDSLEALNEVLNRGHEEAELFGAHIIDGKWPRRNMPYCINGAPDSDLIGAAADHVSAHTNLRVYPMGKLCNIPVGPVPYPFPVVFKNGEDCWSYIGYQNRLGQEIILNENCGFGTVVHEICHAAGLFHEHTRPDRDEHIEILWDNIEEDKKFNFEIRSDAVLFGPYDYESIMHYSEYAFSKNFEPTIRVKTGRSIGQRDTLSNGDIATLNAIYS